MVDLDVSPIIETERLRLRAPKVQDAARLAQLANDADIARMTSSLPHPYSLSDAETFLGGAARLDRERHAAFAMESDGQLIGMLGFHPGRDGHSELGYWLGRPYWGRGLATEAAKGALRWAAQVWRRRFVFARHFSDNAASGQVLCKAGFLYTGEITLSTSKGRSAPAPSRTMVWLA